MSFEITGRSLAVPADEKLAAILRSKFIEAKEIVKILIISLRILGEGPELRDKFQEIKRHKDQVGLIQKDFLSYFSKVAPTLYNKEEWMGIFSKFCGIIDKLGGIAYRVEYLTTKSWKLPEELQNQLISMGELLSSMIDEYIVMINVVLSNSEKTLEFRSKVAAAEREMDSLYRSITFSTLETNLPAPIILLVLNIAEMLEDVADLLDSAANDLYLIALSVT
ncbi:MAG: hypothetical protein NZ954_02610 [Thermofilaceae archaeon]|nr:hypothetical protein [Thermofilaceae archaeon]MCX8181145.1 hypothetical protein [Thermofilaceae archaeon]MDW8004768.1 hypothetical protein [Thermofilaceae archaeon]